MDTQYININDPGHVVVPLPKRPKKARPVLTGWLTGAVKDMRDNVIPNVANALLALRHAAELVDVLGFDEMWQAPMLMKPVPGGHCDGPFPRMMRDDDATSIQAWLQREGLLKLSKDTTFQAVEKRALERKFHPIRDYLGALKWDGKPRVYRWLSRYLGAEQTLYHASIGRMFLIAMVARVYKPGCKADYMLILEGEQGFRKSAACAILAGKEWFSDSLRDFSSKDASAHLRGKWLIEIGELSALNRSDTEAVKAFITRTDERYRAAYGRTEVHEPRQCLFVGTTNWPTYLRDPTGNRRFWPAKTGRLDLEGLARDRDQLFAEAVHAFRKGEQWWPDEDFEREQIKPEQEARRDVDPWEELIREYLATTERVRVNDIARHVLALDVASVGTREQRRISGVLAALGWRPHSSNGVRWYIPSRQ